VHYRGFDGDEELIRSIDAVNARACSTQRELFRLIAEGDRCEVWRNHGAANMAHWVCMRYGISYWKAERWIAASHVLERLPRISEAFACGDLSIDKVVELTRFATPQTEGRLISWAQEVSSGCIRRKGDVAARSSIEEAQEVDRNRSLSWWYFDDGKRFGLEAELPAAQGALLARALDRLAERLPEMAGEDHDWSVNARRADALVALASTRLAGEAGPDRATVVVHAQLDSLVSGNGGCEVEGGGVVHPESVRRLLCMGRVQTVLEDASGTPIRLGRMAREPSAWMMRQLKYRDWNAGFRGAGRADSPRPITSCGGSREAGPTWTTCCWCARSITSSCTSTAGPSGGHRTAPSGGSIRTEPAIGRDLPRPMS